MTGWTTRAALQKAIDAVKPGGRVIVPEGVFDASMATGLTVAGADVRIVLRGSITAHTDGLEAPECRNLFLVTGSGCRFIGQGGAIRGDGATFHGEKSPAVHRVGLLPRADLLPGPRADGAVTDLILSNPPGNHVIFAGVRNCRLSNCTIEGRTKKLHDELKILDGNKRHPRQPVLRRVLCGNLWPDYSGQPLSSPWASASSISGSVPAARAGTRARPLWATFSMALHDHPIYCSGLVDSVVAKQYHSRHRGRGHQGGGRGDGDHRQQHVQRALWRPEHAQADRAASSPITWCKASATAASASANTAEAGGRTATTSLPTTCSSPSTTPTSRRPCRLSTSGRLKPFALQGDGQHHSQHRRQQRRIER